MRCSGPRFASRVFYGGALFIGFRLVVRRRREQGKLNRIDQGTQELPGCRNIVVRNVIQEDM